MTDVAVKENNLPVEAGLYDEFLKDSVGNTGFETVSKDDIAIPFISILQALSPQLRGETKIKGAEEGDFLHTVANRAFKGPVRIIPCAYQKSFVEWVPREQGGGLVAQYDNDEILKQTKKNEKNQDILPNGNHIVTTAYHYCLLVNDDNTFERVVISLTSTQLKKSRRWLSQAMSLMIDVNGKKVRPPMFSHTYVATTAIETKDKNSWYGWNIGTPELIKSNDLYKAAKQFHDEVTKGLVKAQEHAPEDIPAAATTDDSNVI